MIKEFCLETVSYYKIHGIYRGICIKRKIQNEKIYRYYFTFHSKVDVVKDIMDTENSDSKKGNFLLVKVWDNNLHRF